MSLAELIDPSQADAPVEDSTSNALATRRAARSPRVRPAAAAPAAGAPATRRARRGSGAAAKASVRNVVVLSMVAGLVATVAIPAFGIARNDADAVTLQQVAADNAQNLLVASDATKVTITRDSYSATTADEIDKKKAEEAAAQRARAAASASASSSSVSLANINLSMVAPGSGAVRWPLTSFTLGERVGARNGAHQGTDMLAPAMTPIFAAAAGVVAVSQESYGGYGVAIAIDSVIDGQKVGTVYGHMTYGTRQVVAGQSVEAGQLIGFVGSTGRSTANHLHFEVRINGTVVDSYVWLQQNAG